jgi:hypothetical protein
MERRTALKMLVAAVVMAGEWPAEGEMGTGLNSASTPTGPFSVGYSPNGRLEWLPMGEVRPTGWIREQMRRDLAHGFAGCLDKLCPEARSDIFVSHRNTQLSKDSGNAAGSVWWNGETEGNWRTGQIMMAYLAGDTSAMKEVDEYVRHILASQDSDGYLGAFGPDLRYTEQGELWTQACLFRGLLAYSELTQNEDVLKAVRRAADLSIHVYRSGEKPLPQGQSHDLMFIDVAEWLFARTGDPSYPDFALWFYEAWSKTESKWDATLPSLLDLQKGFSYHGVHTFENIRVPFWLAAMTRRPDLLDASNNALVKIARYREPSGSCVSQEKIENLSPDPTLTEYEYCATRELQATFQSAFQKTGKTELADLVETIWFNAAQGARLPDGTAISYLTADNRLHCNAMTPDGFRPQKRNKFSPTHMDVAVCCNPNATQVAAHYVRGMWLHDRLGGLVASLFGPCTVTTTTGGTGVRIEERTNYPFDPVVEFSIFPEASVEFPISLRNPGWSRSTKVTSNGAKIQRVGEFWQVSKKWKFGDTIRVELAPEIRRIRVVNGEVAIQYGPLIFAEPFPSTRKVTKTYSAGKFEDSIYEPTEKDDAGTALPARPGDDGFGLRLVRPSGTMNPDRPFDAASLEIHGRLTNQTDGSSRDLVLVPLGNAPLLRRVTFPETLTPILQGSTSPLDGTPRSGAN